AAASTIWYDDFSSDRTEYTERQNDLDTRVGFGGQGGSLPCVYDKGSQGTGNRKLFFGDSPYGTTVVKAGEKFEEVYWRVYVLHQYGWTGGAEAKLSRITSIVNGSWAQAMIDHVWGSSNETLTLDPVSCVEGDQVLSTGYNDWNAMHWLGNSPSAQMRISSTEESGWWVCVEVRCKLNTPGKSDGETQLWIDGHLETERHNMNFRGSYTVHALNALFLEAYWNEGSPVKQTRWLDNYVVSTAPIGPVTTSVNPTLIKRPYHGPGTQAGWEAELSQSLQGEAVWHGAVQGTADTLRVDAATGRFSGALEGRTALDPGTRYWVRVRQSGSDGAWSEWSRWHQPFVTEGQSATGALDCDWNGDGRSTLADVISFLLFRRDHPTDTAADYDGDGRLSVLDPYRMLKDILAGRCGLPVLAAASAGKDGGTALAPADREYVLQQMSSLPLKENERTALLAALDEASRRSILPAAFSLSQNYPNPFNPQTVIPFSLPESQAPVRVSLKVYDLRNQLVRTLVDGTREAGVYTVFWDGADEQGRTLPSGVYFYRLQAGAHSLTRKMVLLR
ncbi:T9SS type A sorting domain-containing protein, partial [bacterium]|nr:T9SS type A sorting domain-containing protein [bacterium]